MLRAEAVEWLTEIEALRERYAMLLLLTWRFSCEARVARKLMVKT